MAHQTPTPGGPLGDLAVSLIRTGVPLGWGYAAAWLISLGIPQSFLASYHDVAVNAFGAVLTFGWYALWRTLETHLPKLDSYAAQFAVLLALGHPKAPSYGPIPAVSSTSLNVSIAPVETRTPPAV